MRTVDVLPVEISPALNNLTAVLITILDLNSSSNRHTVHWPNVIVGIDHGVVGDCDQFPLYHKTCSGEISKNF